MNGNACLGSEAATAEAPLDRLESFVEEHPLQALAVVAGAGLLAKLLPKRATAAIVGRIVVKALPPALLTLGVLKAWDLLARPRSSGHRTLH